MGGNALKIAKTRRYKASEFKELEREIISILGKHAINSQPLLAYREKLDYGDMDILIMSEDMNEHGDPKDFITREFSPTEIYKNSNVYSFDYKELQIDFILTPRENWKTSFNFFAWNDLGNFIGKIAHKFNLKYGFKGLEFQYRSEDDSRILGQICLSKDPKQILPFLGFSYERWLEGFDSMEDIFEYIIGSKYFSIEPFRFKNLSALHKKRNLRRKMYHEFLSYYDEKTKTTFIHQHQFNKDKDSYHDMIENEFPGFKKQLSDFKKKDEERKRISELFNGNIIIGRYGITGKYLGLMMGSFKARFTDFDQYILNTEPSKIYQDFEDHMNEMK